MIGSPGLNKTVGWLYDTLTATGYYDVKYQDFSVDFVSGNLTVNGVAVPSVPMGFAPEGFLTGTLAAVSNVGCEAVSTLYPLDGKSQN